MLTATSVLLQFDPELVLVSSGYDSGIGDPEVSNLLSFVLSIIKVFVKYSCILNVQ